jgi:hypothetical protein
MVMGECFLVGGWQFFLRFVVKSMCAGAIAFRDQLRLGIQPVLHMLALRRTLVHIAKIGPPGDFVR